MTTALVRPELLAEHLTARLETALASHLERAQTWYPHEYVPWGEARDFAELPFEEAQSRLSKEVRASVQLNLLTEDNLPGYHGAISRVMGYTEVWRTWLDRWTAEEGRHAIAIRDYLLVTRSVDPVALENARMTHMGAGFESANHDDLLRSLAYVSFQELATRISHRNTGKITKDPVADQLLARIALDENLHMLFYRNLLAASLELAPNQAMRAITEVVKSFEMPGSTIENFTRKSVQIALAGVYDLRIHHDDVHAPVLRAWGVWDVEGLDEDGERARLELADTLAKLDQAASRFEEKRTAHRTKLADRGTPLQTV
jgi:acyl-[acyl-carrier-protein] desaturase